MDETIFFDGWSGALRVLVIGTAAYIGLVVMLRASGKRTLSKMNAFDFIVTVALGSTLAAILLDRSVPLVDGLAALGLLIAFQFAITWMSVRSKFVRGLVKSEPTLIARRGEYCAAAMRSQRVTTEEVDAALRQHGVNSLRDVACVVLETDGSLSIVKD